MMKWTLVCAAAMVAGLIADQAQAQEPAKVPATVISSSEVITPAPRTGLLGRLRERRGVTTVSQPIVQVQATQPVPMKETPSEVLQAQHTEKVAMPATTTTMPVQMQVMETRPRLMDRLRARLGR
jgi:hypothetical protein